jgi:dipeptidase E
VKLLLTSSGLRGKTLVDALRELLGKPFAEANVVFVPTASVAVAGSHDWFIEDLNRLHALGWKELNILTFDGLPRAEVLSRLRHADVLYVEGGNHLHLARSIAVNDLAGELRELLETKVYVGVSAGSMIFSRRLNERTCRIMNEEEDLELLGGDAVSSPIGLFDWYLKPHLHSPDFPDRDEAWAERLLGTVDFPLYLIDDASAVRVRGAHGEEIDVVTEGGWRHTEGN